MHTTNENTCVSIVFFVNAFAMLHDTACTDYPTLDTGKFSTVRACRPTTDLHGAARRSRSFAPSPPHPTRASARSLHQPRDCQVQQSLFLSCESNHPPSGWLIVVMAIVDCCLFMASGCFLWHPWESWIQTRLCLCYIPCDGEMQRVCVTLRFFKMIIWKVRMIIWIRKRIYLFVSDDHRNYFISIFEYVHDLVIVFASNIRMLFSCQSSLDWCTDVYGEWLHELSICLRIRDQGQDVFIAGNHVSNIRARYLISEVAVVIGLGWLRRLVGVGTFVDGAAVVAGRVSGLWRIVNVFCSRLCIQY